MTKGELVDAIAKASRERDERRANRDADFSTARASSQRVPRDGQRLARRAWPGSRRAARGSGKALKDALPKDKARKAGLIAGGLAGLTAGSAGISSLRRRLEGARDDS